MRRSRRHNPRTLTRLVLAAVVVAVIGPATIAPAGAGITPLIARNDSYSTMNGETLNVAAPGFMANDQVLLPGDVAQVLSGPAHGSLTPPPTELNGTGAFTYVPDPGFVGTDSFTYCLGYGTTPPSGCASDDAKVSIDVEPSTADDDSYSILSTFELRVSAPGLLANDTVAPGQIPVVVRGPSHGGFPMLLQPDGSFFYQSLSGFSGDDSFTYCIAPPTGSPCVSNIATVSIDVGPLPIANNETFDMVPGGQLNVASPGVLANDENVGSDNIALLVANATYGFVSMELDGSFSYAAAGYFGGDSFTYCIGVSLNPSCVSNVATVTLDADALVAADDSYSTSRDESLEIAAPGVRGNDSAHSATISLALVQTPDHGRLTLRDDGSFVFAPEAGFVGKDSFAYCVATPPAVGCVSNVATVSITVAAADSPRRRLAFTGSDPSVLLVVGATVILLGIVLLIGGRGPEPDQRRD